VDSDGLHHHNTDGKEKKEKPNMSHEKSRGQVLCRNGFKGSKSAAITYGPGKRCATYEEANAMGKRWIAYEAARQATVAGA